MRPALLDRVEIGDVDRRKSVERQKTRDDILGPTRPGESGLDRRIRVARAALGAHHQATLEIDDRNNIHVPRLSLDRIWHSATAAAKCHKRPGTHRMRGPTCKASSAGTSAARI